MGFKVYNVATFEGSQITTWDMEGKTAGNQVEDEYTEWINNGIDFWRVELNPVHAGTRSSSVLFDSGGPSAQYSIPLANQGGEISIELYFYLDSIPGSPTTFHFSWFSADSNWGAEFYVRLFLVTSSVEFRKYDNGSWTTVNTKTWAASSSAWRGIKITVNQSAKTFESFHDYTDSGSWTSVGTGTYTASPHTATWLRMRTTAANWGYNNCYVDDIKYTTSGLTGLGSDYAVSKGMYVSGLKTAGHGFMIVPDQDHNNSSYYNLQEQEIVILNHEGTVICRGEISNSTPVTDGVRLDFREITYQMEQRHCKKNYLLEKGTVTSVGAV